MKTIVAHVKLTDPQIVIIRLLRDGWWLPKLSGIRKGRQTKRCSIDTILALRDQGIIRKALIPGSKIGDQQMPAFERYILTDLGNALELPEVSPASDAADGEVGNG